MKGLTITSGVYNAVLWRSAAGILLAGLPYLAQRPARPGRRALRLHVERGMVCSLMVLLFFWGLARTPMAQAIALCFVAPIVALVLAALLLGERIGRQTIGASAAAFAGVLVILAGQARTPAGPQAVEGTAAILGSALCYAYNLILMRRQAQASDPIEVAFFQHLVTGLCFLPFLPLFGAMPAPGQVPAVLGAAALGTCSLFFLAWAYARAEANRLAPSEYTGFLWACLFGWMVFGEPVGLWTLAGATMIVAGCLAAARSGKAAIPEESAL